MKKIMYIHKAQLIKASKSVFNKFVEENRRNRSIEQAHNTEQQINILISIVLSNSNKIKNLSCFWWLLLIHCIYSFIFLFLVWKFNYFLYKSLTTPAVLIWWALLSQRNFPLRKSNKKRYNTLLCSIKHKSKRFLKQRKNLQLLKSLFRLLPLKR